MGSCGAAAYRKEAVISADIATDPSWSGAGEEGRRVALSHGLRAAWAVPLLSKNKQLMGTFALYYTSVRRPTADDVRLVETAARVALIAIERDRSRAALNDAIAEIKKSEAELRTIVSMIPQLVVVLAPDGTTSFVNQMMLDYAGLTASEVTGADFRSRVFHPDDVERLKSSRAGALERGLPFENEQRGPAPRRRVPMVPRALLPAARRSGARDSLVRHRDGHPRSEARRGTNQEREPGAARGDRPIVDVRGDRRSVAGAAAGARARGEGRADRLHRADHRRDRHGQGARRPRDPPALVTRARGPSSA